VINPRNETNKNFFNRKNSENTNLFNMKKLKIIQDNDAKNEATIVLCVIKNIKRRSVVNNNKLIKPIK